MANTYVAIATVTVGSGGANSIDFNSIPGTYTDLIILTSIRDTSAGSSPAQGAIRFNGDSGNNYYRRYIRGNGSTADGGASAAISAYVWRVIQPGGATANTFGSTFIYIPNYASSNLKSISMDNITENNATEAHQELSAGLWNSTAAITSISILGASGQIIGQHSTATLYGIKKN
jgi:hypothetical protein